jgi:hypothetical protein
VNMAPSGTAPSATSNGDDCSSIMSKMLVEFRSKKTFGQVMKLYNKKKTAYAYADVEDEGDVLLDTNLYLKRGALPSSLGRFNIIIPVERMLVQTDLGIEGCPMDEIVGTVMVVHLDRYDRLTEGLLNVYFLDSVFEPMNISLLIKSSKVFIRPVPNFRPRVC